MHRQQNRFSPVAQQFRIQQRAGRDHAHHLALDRAFAGGHITDLLANGHRFAQLDQLGQIAVKRMKRHPGHRHRHPGGLPTLRQRDAQQARGFLGIAKKHLVEIPHAVEHQRVGVVRLEGEVLDHHGRVSGSSFRGGFQNIFFPVSQSLLTEQWLP